MFELNFNRHPVRFHFVPDNVKYGISFEILHILEHTRFSLMISEYISSAVLFFYVIRQLLSVVRQACSLLLSLYIFLFDKDRDSFLNEFQTEFPSV